MQRFSHKASTFLEKKIFKCFFPYKCIGQKRPCRKKIKCQCTIIILAILIDPHHRLFMQRFNPKAFSVLEKKIFKGFNYIWAWWPSWSKDRNHFSYLSFPQPKEAPYETWAKLAQGLQRRSCLKMLMDRQKVITIARLEQSSGELNMFTPVNPFFLYMTLGLPVSSMNGLINVMERRNERKES